MIEAALAALDNDKQRNELAAFYEQYKNRFKFVRRSIRYIFFLGRNRFAHYVII